MVYFTPRVLNPHPPGKGHWYVLNMKLGGVLSRCWRFKEEKHWLPLPRIELPFLGLASRGLLMKLAKISWLSSLRSDCLLDCTLWYGTLVFKTIPTEIALKKQNCYWSEKASVFGVTSPPASFLLPQIKKDCLGVEPISRGKLGWDLCYWLLHTVHFFAIRKPYYRSGKGKVKDKIHPWTGYEGREGE